MKKYLTTTAATAALVAMSTPASAEAYLKIFAGANMMDDTAKQLFSVDGSTTVQGTLANYLAYISRYTAGPYGSYTIDYAYHYWKGFSAVSTYHSELNADISVDSGFVVGAAIGREVMDGLSVELEMSLRKNDAKGEISFTSYFSQSGNYGWYYEAHYTVFYYGSPIFYKFPATSFTVWGPYTGFYNSGGTTDVETISGELRAFSIMANAWYDIDLGNEENFTPYIGGGIGWADVELDLGSYSASDSGFALQVGGGVRFNVAEGVELDIGYRYFTAPGMDFITPLGYDMGVDYESHEVTVGLKFAL